MDFEYLTLIISSFTNQIVDSHPLIYNVPEWSHLQNFAARIKFYFPWIQQKTFGKQQNPLTHRSDHSN